MNLTVDYLRKFFNNTQVNNICETTNSISDILSKIGVTLYFNRSNKFLTSDKTGVWIKYGPYMELGLDEIYVLYGWNVIEECITRGCAFVK